MSQKTDGSGPAREIPCLACAKAATKRGDGVCRDNLAKPNSHSCEYCWATHRPCLPVTVVLLPFLRNVTDAIAAGDEEETENARRELRIESIKYRNRVGDKNKKRRRRGSKSGVSRQLRLRAPAPKNAKTEEGSDSKQYPDEPTQLDSISVASRKAGLTPEVTEEEVASVSGRITSDIKQELLEIGNEIYQTGAEKFRAEGRPMETGDRLKDIGERLVYIASKLETE